jgi:hypothetical protein
MILNMTKNKGDADNTKLVSFKISHDLFKELERYAASQKDEAGLLLSPSLAARRLMLDALKKLKR